ncbi:MAG: GerMN domain-containing protein [Treponemataceae bacterium]|nr:GerMN domain-containing protein [Treponemataceae bacterium]
MSQKNNSTVILFFIIAVAVVFSIFAMNIGRIKEVLEKTQFVEAVFGDENEAPKPKNDKNNPSSAKDTAPLPKDEVFAQKPAPVQPSVPNISPFEVEVAPAEDITKVVDYPDFDEKLSQPGVVVPPANSSVAINEQTANNAGGAEQAEKPAANSGATSQIAQPEEEKPIELMNTKVFFVFIDASGTLVRKECARSIAKTNSPLTATLRNLLMGPNAEEDKKGYISLIPQGTVLQSATVKNKIAYLSFNDQFQWNKYGVEGYMGQLTQIIYTATAFPTVDAVQFLIDGEKQDYLGTEGIWIGTPLRRENFR